jgi:hypothetical protein
MSAVRSRQRAPNQNNHLASRNVLPQMAYRVSAEVSRDFLPRALRSPQHGESRADLGPNDENGGFDQTQEFRGTVVGCHIPGLVTQQVVAILLADARRPKWAPKRMPQHLSPLNGSISFRVLRGLSPNTIALRISSSHLAKYRVASFSSSVPGQMRPTTYPSEAFKNIPCGRPA